jgi:hypothetical protein
VHRFEPMPATPEVVGAYLDCGLAKALDIALHLKELAVPHAGRTDCGRSGGRPIGRDDPCNESAGVDEFGHRSPAERRGRKRGVGRLNEFPAKPLRLTHRQIAFRDGVVAFGNDAISFGPELVTLFHSSIALMERPAQERDPAVKLKRDHPNARSSHNPGDPQ